MAEINDEKLKMMEDEMNRFEEEIGLPNLPLPSIQTKAEPHRTVIGANTYNQVQEQLDKQLETIPEPLKQARQMIPPQMRVIPPPPPPPPPMFIPPQVQRVPGPPIGPMEGMGGPPGNMNFGPGPGHMAYSPMRFGPQGGPPMGPGGPGHMGPNGPGHMGPNGPGHMGPNGPGHMGPNGPGHMGPNGPGHMGPNGPGHMGPNGPGNMGPNGPGHMGPNGPGHMGPNGPGHMGPNGPGHMGPNGPGHMGPNGPGHMGSNGPGPMGQMMGPHMGGPGPMMPPHFQGQLPSGPPGPMMPPGFMPPPPPEFLGPMPGHAQAQGPVVLSATPKLYMAKCPEEPLKAPTVGPEYPIQPVELPDEKKNNKKFGTIKPVGGAKEMAEKVKTTTVISITQDNSSGQQPKKKEKKNKKMIRTAGGQTWEDSSLMEWEDDDFRLFCGDLGNDVTDEVLTRAFSKYSSFLKARVVRDKRTNKTKGFGFVSFKDPQDFIRATKEMNGRYVGSRPIKLRKSTWKARSIDVVRKKEKEKTALISLLTGRT